VHQPTVTSRQDGPFEARTGRGPVSPTVSCHEWIIAPRRHDRARALAELDGPYYRIQAHRNLRGPYSGAGELIRLIIPQAYKQAPKLVEAYQLTLLSIAPEIADHVPVSPELARSFEFTREGNSQFWTLRLSHGLTDFLLQYFESASDARPGIMFDDADKADPLDQEFFAVLLRRADPRKLLVQIGSSSSSMAPVLGRALETHARIVELPSSGVARTFQTSEDDLARRYVSSDCTSDDPLEIEAYSLLDAQQRRQLHGERIAALTSSNSASLRLGAIPFHYEQAAQDVEPLLSASVYCMSMAYYDACLDWALRGLRMLPSSEDSKLRSDLSRNALFSLLLLGRLEEAEATCLEIQSSSHDPALLAHSAYAMAILNVRLYSAERRNYAEATLWLEKAVAFTERVPSATARPVNLAFLMNTRALVEMRQGRPFDAIRLLSDGLEFLQAQAPAKYALECPLLLHNRARVHIALKDFGKAVEDFTALLKHEPSNSEAYFDRGIIHQRLGRYEEALEDYNRAIQWSPPYDEPYFNRAQTLTALGRYEAALADYDYVLTLEPESVPALINRACLLYERKDYEACGFDVQHALERDPRHARLLSLRGLLEMQKRHLDEAVRSFTSAIESDPAFIDAWINRAAARFAKREYNGALDDLTHVLAIREDPRALFNRGRVFQALERWQEAANDYSRALELDDSDSQAIGLRLRTCEQQMQSTDSAG
jgi:tetratricopeptide (TPR) repeat protein